MVGSCPRTTLQTIGVKATFVKVNHLPALNNGFGQLHSKAGAGELEFVMLDHGLPEDRLHGFEFDVVVMIELVQSRSGEFNAKLGLDQRCPSLQRQRAPGLEQCRVK